MPMSRAAKKHKKSRAVTGVGSIGLVRLICDKSGCPRTKMVERDDTMPDGTATMRVVCPWHDDGDFHEASYFDKEGTQIFYQPNAQVNRPQKAANGGQNE